MSKSKKRRGTGPNCAQQYCNEDQDSEKKVYTIEDNYKRKKFSYNHLEGDECLPYSKKHLPKSKAASKNKFQNNTSTYKKKFLLKHSKKPKCQAKQLLDKPSENDKFSNEPECQVSNLDQNSKPGDTGLFFYATVPGECYTSTKMYPPVCRIYL